MAMLGIYGEVVRLACRKFKDEDGGAVVSDLRGRTPAWTIAWIPAFMARSSGSCVGNLGMRMVGPLSDHREAGTVIFQRVR